MQAPRAVSLSADGGAGRTDLFAVGQPSRLFHIGNPKLAPGVVAHHISLRGTAIMKDALGHGSNKRGIAAVIKTGINWLLDPGTKPQVRTATAPSATKAALNGAMGVTAPQARYNPGPQGHYTADQMRALQQGNAGGITFKPHERAGSGAAGLRKTDTYSAGRYSAKTYTIPNTSQQIVKTFKDGVYQRGQDQHFGSGEGSRAYWAGRAHVDSAHAAELGNHVLAATYLSSKGYTDDYVRSQTGISGAPKLRVVK